MQIGKIDAVHAIEIVAAHFGFTKEDILSKRKHEELAAARQMAMYILREVLGLSLKQAGLELHRDHTTVMYGANTLKEKLKTDSALKKNVGEIRAQLNMK